VLVREGDVVTHGQVVAKIDAAAFSDQLHQGEAAVARARVERENAEATRARLEKVYQHGIAARQEVDDAAARAASARAAEAAAEAGAQHARRDVDRATVKSPLAGVVIKVLRRSGELVDGTPATPVVEIADPSKLELVANAAAPDLVRVRVGHLATVTISALPGQAWKGTVAAVSPAVDRATGLGTVRVSLALDEERRPPVGVLGTARILVGDPRPAATVPREALRGTGGEAEVVLCGPDGIAHTRTVHRGVVTGDSVEVTGVLPGDSVVVQPILGVTDGEAIEPEAVEGDQ
jgi:RND family efflux transporter MFP subunit